MAHGASRKLRSPQRSGSGTATAAAALVPGSGVTLPGLSSRASAAPPPMCRSAKTDWACGRQHLPALAYAQLHRREAAARQVGRVPSADQAAYPCPTLLSHFLGLRTRLALAANPPWPELGASATPWTPAVQLATGFAKHFNELRPAWAAFVSCFTAVASSRTLGAAPCLEIAAPPSSFAWQPSVQAAVVVAVTKLKPQRAANPAWM